MSNDFVYEIRDIINKIAEFPQTYKTMLKEKYGSFSECIILKRKMARLLKEGIVFRAKIAGRRFPQHLFYLPEKKINIVMEATRVGSNVYCFYKHRRSTATENKLKKLYIHLDECWFLQDSEWIKKENVVLFEGDLLRWI